MSGLRIVLSGICILLSVDSAMSGTSEVARYWIKDKLSDGSIIQLDDRTLYLVDRFDRYSTRFWSRMDDIAFVQKDGEVKMLNLDAKEFASVKSIKD